MEKYKNPKMGAFHILSMARSKERLTISSDKLPDEMKLSFLPYLIVNEKKKTLTAILTGQFQNEKEEQLTNQLAFQMEYKIEGEMPVSLVADNKLIVTNNEMIVAIFDTTIGAFRGVLFEWLMNSELQRPLPLIEVGDFLNQLKVSFTK